MSECEVIGDDGKPADIRSGDVVTTNGGMAGLGHAGIIDKRGDKIVVIEVMAAPDGSVHVQERDICDFLEDYAKQDREVFISRPKQPGDTTDADWAKKLGRVVKYVKDRICNRFPVWKYVLDLLFHLPEIWYCSDLVAEAFRREGIELELTTDLWDASDDRETRDFMFMQRGEAQRRFGEVDGLHYLRGFELAEGWATPPKPGRRLPDGVPPILALSRSGPPQREDCGGCSLEAMVSEQLFHKEIERLGELWDIELELLSRELREQWGEG